MLNNTNLNNYEQTKQKDDLEFIPVQQIRKPYSKPALAVLGDLRTSTFGSLPGITDSDGEGWDGLAG